MRDLITVPVYRFAVALRRHEATACPLSREQAAKSLSWIGFVERGVHGGCWHPPTPSVLQATYQILQSISSEGPPLASLASSSNILCALEVERARGVAQSCAGQVCLTRVLHTVQSARLERDRPRVVV